MRFVCFFVLLTFCQPFLIKKDHEIEWNIKAPHTLFHHQFMQSFNQNKHLVTADVPTKITLSIKEPTNAPLLYIPGKDNVNVERWHMKYIIEYTIEAQGRPIKKGILKTQHSYQDFDDYGNILIAAKGNDKAIHAMLHEIILLLNI